MEVSDEAKGLLEVLKYSLDQQSSDMNRMMSFQASYDNKINSVTWPTQSEIGTAQHFIATEEALGPAMDSCFPETNGIQLIPEEVDVTEEQWRNSEWALWTMVNHKMKIRDAALRSVKDCFKSGIGYGIVEPFTFIPDASAKVVIGKKSTRIMTQGDPVISIRYRYISPGKVIPYPSGTDFNGPEATPMSFLYDPHPLWQIEAMFKGEGGMGIDPEELQATLADVKEAAATFNKFGVTDFTGIASVLGGRGNQSRKSDIPDMAPEDVPIIKVFIQPGTEVWIVPSSGIDGLVLIKRESDGINQLRNGLVKWDAWPDGDRWYPMSQPEADQKRGVAYDLWLNYFFDMMTKSKDTPRVINQSALPPDREIISPYEDIYIASGSVRDAAGYLEAPRIDPSIPAMGDVLQGLGQKIQGQTDVASKNFTRGGANAFNDMLNTIQARQRLTATILETGALSAIYEHVLAYMKNLVPDGGYNLQRPLYNADEAKTILEKKTITAEDLRHGYNIVLDTSERRMLGGMSDQARFQYWQALIDRDEFRPWEVNKLLPLPDAALRRMQKPREIQEEQQAVDREVSLIGELGGGGGGATVEATAQTGGLQ